LAKKYDNNVVKTFSFLPFMCCDKFVLKQADLINPPLFHFIMYIAKSTPREFNEKPGLAIFAT
jgi:hypothetical protein